MSSRSPLCVAWLILLLFLSAPGLKAQVGNARIKNFQAPASDESGRKSFLKGADASHVGNGIFQITTPHVETYKPDGAIDFIIDATQCLFDKDKTKEVWSDSSLSMKTGDGRLTLRGVAFRWVPSKSHLMISNQVQATIRRDAIGQAQNATNQSTIAVTADRLDYSPEATIFGGHVYVKDAQGEVRCETLKVVFDAANSPQTIEAIDNVILTQGQTEARGKRALYTASSGLLRLSEGASWSMGDRTGSSDLLIWDRTNSTLRAEINVRMIIPSTLISTNAAGATNKSKIDIHADTFDYAQTNTVTHGAIAIFNGNVHAVDPQATLDCALLTIFFNATNKLTRAVADREVVVTRPDGEIRGPKAVFENDEILVTDPTWRMDEKSGSSQSLAFNPKTREIRALRNVRMQMPSTSTNLIAGGFISTAVTNAHSSGAVTNFVTVVADAFTNLNNTATFSRNVRVTEIRGQIDANFLTLTYNSSNRVERIVAEGDVILTEQKVQAIGQRADYDLRTQQIQLTGHPKVMADGREIIAREFQIDRAASKFKPLAPFHIQIPRGTNTIALPL